MKITIEKEGKTLLPLIEFAFLFIPISFIFPRKAKKKNFSNKKSRKNIETGKTYLFCQYMKRNEKCNGASCQDI